MSFEVLHNASTKITDFLDLATFDPREETLTEMLLVDLQSQLTSFSLEEQTTGEENKNGADFLLTIASGGTTYIFFIQAKRLYSNGRYDALLHSSTPKAKKNGNGRTIHQYETLGTSQGISEDGNTIFQPLYLFFNSPHYGSFAKPLVELSGTAFTRHWMWHEGNDGSDGAQSTIAQSPLGVTICAYPAVATALSCVRSRQKQAKANKDNGTEGPKKLGKKEAQDLIGDKAFLGASIPFEHLIDPRSFVENEVTQPKPEPKFSDLFEKLLATNGAKVGSSSEAEGGKAGSPSSAWELIDRNGIFLVRTPEGAEIVPRFRATLDLTEAYGSESISSTETLEAPKRESTKPESPKRRSRRERANSRGSTAIAWAENYSVVVQRHDTDESIVIKGGDSKRLYKQIRQTIQAYKKKKKDTTTDMTLE